MELKELTNLISIRQYVITATSSFNIDRKSLNELSGILLLLDKKIMSLLMGSEFKDYVGYANVQQAIQNVANINNIKSAIKK